MDMFNVNSDKVCKNAVYIFDNYLIIIFNNYISQAQCIMYSPSKTICSISAMTRKGLFFFFYCAKKNSKNLFLLFTRCFIAD